MLTTFLCLFAFADSPDYDLERHFQEVLKQETEFTLPADKGDEAWDRAQVFISQATKIDILTTTNAVLETKKSAADFCFQVTRHKQGGNYQFKITGSGLTKRKSEVYARAQPPSSGVHVCCLRQTMSQLAG